MDIPIMVEVLETYLSRKDIMQKKVIHMKLRHLFSLFGILVMVMAISACQTTEPPTDQDTTPSDTPDGDGADETALEPGTYEELSTFDPDTKLKGTTFENEDAFSSFVKSYESTSYYGGYMQKAMSPQIERVANDVAMGEAADPGMAGGEGATDYSETNVQVEGIY